MTRRGTKRSKRHEEKSRATRHRSSRRRLAALTPSAAARARSSGSSVRALGRDELAEARSILASTPASVVAREFAIDPGRTRTLAAGAVILSALQERLDAPLRVVRGGLRDGAISELEARALAA